MEIAVSPTRDRTASGQALSSRTHATISRLLRPVRVKDPGERLHTGPHACRSSHQGNRGPLQWSSASSCELGSALKQRTGAGLLSRPEGTLSGRFGPVCCSAGPQTGWHPARLILQLSLVASDSSYLWDDCV